MTTGKLGLTFAACFFAAAPALAGEELTFSIAPDWVVEHAVRSAEGDSSGQPVRVLLVDNQVQMVDGKRSSYSAFALQFQTPEGLSAGNLSLAWRPETDELTVHKVLIHRGDQTIDVLASGQTFTTLRREQNLDQATLDGVLTANLFPEGLQVGDILEVATTSTSANPALGEHDEAILGPLNAPIDHAYARLMWPQGQQMQLARSAGMPEWKRSRKAGFEIAQIELAGLQTTPLPSGAPSRYAFLGFLEASDFASWSELSRHFAPIYATASKLPAQGPLRVEVERIRAASSDRLAQAEAALDLVQARVRYVALAMGEGGLMPANAELTWSRRFGDCKGKTALLLAILGELGIQAEPVFVNSALGDAVAERLPMIAMFNHVLVRAHIDGREYWLDGTRTGDTSLARLKVPAFSWGLPVLSEGAELVRMIPAPLETPDEDLVIKLDASNGIRAPVPAALELTLRGDTAQAARQNMANLVGDARDRALREYWRGRFDFIEPEAVAMSYDEVTGDLSFSLKGKATLDWDGQWYEADEISVGYRADFKREPGQGSNAPYAVAYPDFDRTHETIILPPKAGFTAASVSSVSEVDETVAGIEYRRHASLIDDTFVIERTARSVATEFPASDAPAFEKRLRELRDKRVYLRIPHNYRATEADLGVTLAQPGETATDLIAQGLELSTAGKRDEAVARFTRATEIDPNNAEAWARLAFVEIDRGKLDQAARHIATAETINPSDVIVPNGKGAIAERRGDWKAAVDAYSKALERDPQNIYARSHRANARMGLQQWELALTDAADVLKADPRQGMMYGVRVSVLSWLGRKQQAEAEVDQLLAAFPDEDWAKRASSTLYAQLGLTDKARALTDRTLQGQPTAFDHFNHSRSRAPLDRDGRLSDLNEALRLDPKFSSALMSRAALQYDRGNSDAALADLATLIELDPKMAGPHFLKANILSSLGRKEEAVAEAKAWIAADPDSNSAHVGAGQLLASLGMREEALAEVEQALQIKPEAFIYLVRSGLRQDTDWVARLADVEEALRLAPGDFTSLFTKADILVDKGDFLLATEVYSDALVNNPNNVSVFNGRGIAFARAGRSTEAEADFARAGKLATDAQQLNNICYEKAVAGVALDRALKECDESLRLLPDLAGTLDSRGTVLLQLGRLDEAIRDFDQALKHSPHQTNSIYLRAVARSKQGDYAGAHADLALVREASPSLIESMERNGFVVLQSGGTTTQ